MYGAAVPSPDPTKSAHRRGAGAPDVAERRKKLKRQQPLLNPDRLVFNDETWGKTNITQPRGRALKGERSLASVPHGYWKTTRCLAAPRSTGMTAL